MPNTPPDPAPYPLVPNLPLVPASSRDAMEPTPSQNANGWTEYARMLRHACFGVDYDGIVSSFVKIPQNKKPRSFSGSVGLV